MAVFNPDDPFNWLGIDAELKDQAAGPNPDGSTRYSLPSMGMDPAFIAYLAQFDANRVGLDADKTLRKSRAQSDYEQALRDLEQQGLTGAYNNDTSLLSRGVFNSGERTRRQGELTNVLGEGRSRADTTLANVVGQTDADYERALTQLNTEREAQIVASKARIAEAQRTGAAAAGMLTGTGGGGGTTSGGGSSPGGGTTAPTTTIPGGYQPTQQQAAAQSYASNYNNPGGGRGAYGPVATAPAPPKPAVVSTSKPGGGRAPKPPKPSLPKMRYS